MVDQLFCVKVGGELYLRDVNPHSGIYKIASKQKDWQLFEKNAILYKFNFPLEIGDIIDKQLVELIDGVYCIKEKR